MVSSSDLLRDHLVFVDGDCPPLSLTRTFRNCDEAIKAGYDFVPHRQDEPTQLQPGSEEKIQLLIQRYEAGLELHHPEDRTTCPKYRRIEIVNQPRSTNY